MVEYRCYFFGSAPSADGVAGGHEAAETFSADNDEHARLWVDVLSRGRRDHAQGLELWQASRLVHRHTVRRANG